MRYDDEGLQHLLEITQDGVVSRQQVLGLGGTDGDIARMVRRRELARIHPGVFINHTGVPTVGQREQAALLACEPAALGFESALGMPTGDGRIRVVVPSGRKVRPVRGVRVQGITRFEERVDPMSSPPRIAFAESAIDTAAERDEAAAFTLLSDALWTRRTTIDQLRKAMAKRQRMPHRTLILAMLGDLEEGTCSVLERGYLHNVEAPHGLPRMSRQAKDVLAGRTIYRDGEFAEFGLVVELDGIAHHTGSQARGRDSVRDLETLAQSNEATARLTHVQVFREACRTAQLIGRILQRRGWPGTVLRCPRCP